MGTKTYSLTREQVAELCPSCAEKMALQRIKVLKLEADAFGNLLPQDETTLKLFAGFSQGMCDKFGPEKGLFTRCASAMAGKVDDENAFCASLEKYCTGQWPAEKKHTSTETEHAQGKHVCEKVGDAWAVKDSKGAVVSTHPSEEMAKAAMKKLHSSTDENKEMVLEYSNNIRGLEIFKTGTHNGDPYTVADLDEMVAAHKELDYRPAIKIGHTKDTPGAPAYGWVTNLRRVGEKLYADLESMHDSVVDAIRKRMYDRVSSEIYFNLNRGGKKYPRALKAVALLGAEVPAVANLTPLHKMEFAADGFDTLVSCEQQLTVSDAEITATLAERVAGLVNLMKEYDMSKNTGQIKELKAQVEEFNQKMEELKKKNAGKSDEELEADAEYKAMLTQAEELSDKIAQLEAEDSDNDAKDQKLAELQAQLSEAQSATTKLAERIARMEQGDRIALVGTKVSACKIPAFRPALNALYAYALEHTEQKVKVYSKGKDGQDVVEDHTLTDVVDGMVTEINAQSEKLFKALAYSGKTIREDAVVDDDPGQEIQKRVTEYRVKHPEVKDYSVALSAVLKEDPELARKYTEQAGTQQ